MDPQDSRLISIEPAGLDDAAEVLALQKLAFQSEAALWDDDTIPPLTQTLDQIAADFGSHRYLKAVEGGRIVGAVRGRLEHGTCHVGRLMVHPDLQNQGLGKRLMAAVEAHFPSAERFEIFTGEISLRNIHLYEKLGYRAFKTQRLNAKVTLVFMEKGRGVCSNSLKY
jgi:ribosomal protein S18 acetylase RimI-like enzyme